MSIETEKKRLTDYLNEQVAERHANKARARAHCASTIDVAGYAIKKAKEHVASQIAALDAAEAQDANA